MIRVEERNVWKSGFWGVSCGAGIHLLTHPLDVVKIHQQCGESSSKSWEVAGAIFRKEGIGGFYRGLLPALIKSSCKRAWCWPIITEAPLRLQNLGIKDLPSQAITGCFVAGIDAALNTPLERFKVLRALGREGPALHEIWRGSFIHAQKLSVQWITFLVAQRYLRRLAEGPTKKELSLKELTAIGSGVALIVSIAAAPFDRLHTLKQSGSPLSLRPGKLCAGLSLSAVALIAQSVASVVLLHKLGA